VRGGGEGVIVSKTTDQLVELVQPILSSGEELLATARFNYNGTLPGNTMSIDSSISALDAVADRGAPDPDAVVGFPTANQMAVALTGGRLFVWSLGMSGKPKQFIGEVPVTAVAKIRSGGAGYGQQMHVTMKSGAIVDLEFMRGESAEDFYNQLAALVG
jgi:hypothetical protein